MLIKKTFKTLKFISHFSRMLVGVPEYEDYISHMKKDHPDKKPLSERDFYKNRLEARYGGLESTVSRC